MKKDMPLEGLRWSRDSGSALYDTPQNGRSRTGWGGSGQPTLFPVMVTTIRTSMAATLSSIQKSMPALKAEPVMPTSPVCIMVKDTSWLPPICACARVTNGQLWYRSPEE